MSGGNVAYQLRPNKHVERSLFVELLQKACPNASSQYAYISMGGPQLEDHKLIHHDLGLNKLFSFEEDKIVYGRQQFNRRPACLTCFPGSISDFVNGFDSFIDREKVADKYLIIWLDYASPQRREQLVEFETLLSKLQEKDILKITINANPGTLGELQSGETQQSLFRRRLNFLNEQLGEYLSPTVIENDMTGKRLPPVLSQVIGIAAEKATFNRPRLKPLLLSLFSYQDGNHVMLTATIRLTSSGELEEYIAGLRWEYLPTSWSDVHTINVPLFTAKERLEIESKLPTDDFDALYDQLPFHFYDEKEKANEIAMLQEYARHYRRYPSYFQVII